MKTPHRAATICACAAVLLATAAAWAADAPEVIFRRAESFDREGKIAQAVEQYKSFLEHYPKHSQAAECHFQLAKGLDAIGHVDGAVEHLDKALDPANKHFRKRQDALYLLGKLLGDLKEYERAVKAFEKLLATGAGLYEEEALNLCGGYYAVLKRYDEAAAKLNILKRRKDSRYAERAAYKLALIWLEARNIELAVEAVSDLASRFPRNQEARGLMLRLANVFREQRKFDQAVAVCEQLKSKFPRSREAQAATYVVGLCLRDRGQFEPAVEKLQEVTKVPENVRSGLAAEAALESADIYYNEIKDTDRAMGQYEEAAGLAREYADVERRDKILEHCYFRLAEHYFAQEKWSVALEFYSLLREVGTEINILPRIMQCQHELDMNMDAFARREEEVAFLKKKIAENPGTFAAAEGEVFLADIELSRLKESTRSEEPFQKVAAQYRDILKRYPDSVLNRFYLQSYINVQLAHCLSHIYGARREIDPEDPGWQPAVAAFRRAIEVDPGTPYRQECLEWIASLADTAGEKELAFRTYRELYELTGERLREDADDEESREQRTGYLRSMLARAGEEDSIDTAIDLCRGIIEEQGVGAEDARHALFYMAELYYLGKDFSAAAKTYKRFVRTYGPPQKPDESLADGPWDPEQVDEKTAQVFEAAIRVAHAWHLQGHTQNMLKAYRWVADNFPNRNKHVAEARYWLAMELTKGPEAGREARRRQLAEALWTGVVAPWFLDAPAEARNLGGEGKKPRRRRGKESPVYHFWVRDRDVQDYVKTAIVKTGELLSGLKEHEMAAEAFDTYLTLYPPRTPRPDEPVPPDELYRIARYALGQEYVALGEIEKLAEVYKPYLYGERDDKFRLPGLRYLGFHASSGDVRSVGVEAYATILDEYGENELDEEGEPIPVPKSERIRSSDYGWNGIRLPPPEGLDLGQVRYALGFLYWKNEEWDSCVRALLPFVDDPELAGSKSRARALFMVGRGYYSQQDYGKGAEVLATLVAECPDFDAVDEVYAEAARGFAEQKQWDNIEQLYAAFAKRHARSLRRPHMDLYAALAALYTGDVEAGRARLKGLVDSDAYEDVKADALYHLGLLELNLDRAVASGGGFQPTLTEDNYRAALRLFQRSLGLYPRERSCLAAARCHVELEDWEKARTLLNRTLTDFADGDRHTIEQAKRLLPTVLKRIAEQREDRG